MVIVLASTLGSYAYAQSGTANSVKANPPIINKNKSKKPPPPPPPPAPPLIDIQEELPAPPAPPPPPFIEESTIIPAPPPHPPPPPLPVKKGGKKINKPKI